MSRLADPVNLIMTTKGSRGKHGPGSPVATPPFVGAEKNCVTRCAKCKNAKKRKELKEAAATAKAKHALLTSRIRNVYSAWRSALRIRHVHTHIHRECVCEHCH